jgi:predicted CoA-binding protein/GNAT superfamily N-acetyltransferase
VNANCPYNNDAQSTEERSEMTIEQSQSIAVCREGDIILRDGSTAHVRPSRPEDETGLLALFRSLSEQSRWLRFFAPVRDSALAVEARREVDTDYTHTFGIVATTGPEQRIVGHAFYARLAEEKEKETTRAEVAFAVADEYQGRGLGTILLGQLAEAAAKNGINVFEAEVMSANHKMLGVFRESGFPIEVDVEAGQLHVTFPTSFTREAIERFEQRERIAAVNAIKLFFNPRAVAVIGASRKRDSIGGVIFHNLLSYGFNGPVYPVNPASEVVQSVPAYPSVEAIPGPVDLAIVVVPAAHVIKAAEECGRKGVRALVVISAEFAEAGGVQVEVLRDISVRLTPLTNEDAKEMIRSLKSYRLLTGFRGGPSYDVAALEQGLLRVSAMVEDLPQIAELDLNPFIVAESSAVILDARIRVAAVEPPPMFGARG